MRRLVGLISGAVGGFAAYRYVRRRTAVSPEAPAEPDTRAEELRAKLAEKKVADPAGEEAPTATAESTIVQDAAPETGVEPALRETLDEHRRRVHEEGRAALDEMQSE
jgi:hypothetical protein